MRSSYSRFNVLVYLLDGSKDDQTLQVYEKYKTDWIIYEHLPDTTLQYRFFRALNNIDAEYICLTKDNFFPKSEAAEELMQWLDKGYDYLQFAESWLESRVKRILGGVKEKEFSSVAECCKKTTQLGSGLFGAVFLKKSSYRLVTYEEHCKEYGVNEFFYLIYYYNYLASESFRGFFTVKFFPQNRLPPELQPKRRSFWLTRELFFEVWGKDWCKAIRRFKCLNDDEKKYITACISFLSGFKNFIYLRLSGILDHETYTQYEEEIKQITPVDHRIVYLISITPVFVFRAMQLVYRCLKKIKSLFVKH